MLAKDITEKDIHGKIREWYSDARYSEESSGEESRRKEIRNDRRIKELSPG